MVYLLDTNHCSRLIFGEPIICHKVEQIGESLMATNLIVAGELIFMAQKSEYKDENFAKVTSFLSDINRKLDSLMSICTVKFKYQF